MPIPATTSVPVAGAHGEPLAHVDADLIGIEAPQDFARGVVRKALAELDDGWVEDIVLVADELVGNADQHVQAEGPMGISVHLYEWGVVVQVSDSDSDVAAIPRESKQPDLDAEGGRGLFLVNALASAWTVQQTDTGKSVTAVFLHEPSGGWR
ncbi:ATP-binding protein [Streptomyces cellulosae]|uniref:ATP-binding protein n=1 Tax=Streptomyces althioticus TaxID=83380 RepID=A0ABZ1YFS5_9ACTN|nr:ATP-binding protein [Streptomyces cellulosae]WTB86565.1 ATP-binding protein [Streptomyces cellulosae]WTB93374.1 ATP-binding protein [Streptomyces cellulosae]WTC60766.1 ATP-binding protein [Streptomyces cellulosae]